MKLRFIFAIIFSILFTSFIACDDKGRIAKKEIIGPWQVDSALIYYNGLSHVQIEEGHDWGLYVFSQDSILRESKFGTYRSFYYGFNENDSLYLSPTNAHDTIAFQIIMLSKEQMALKMPKAPIFKSSGPQERFEIRYYSRTSAPTEKLSVLFGYKE